MKIFLQRYLARSLTGAFLILMTLGAAGCASSPAVAQRPNGSHAQRDENFVGQQRTTVSTGSNLVQDANVAGNRADTRSQTSVYGQGDLQRTGGNDVGDSLRRLDPSIH